MIQFLKWPLVARMLGLPLMRNIIVWKNSVLSGSPKLSVNGINGVVAPCFGVKCR